MEREQFQKKLEELGRLAKEKENRLRAEEVREFLGEMELTEEQYQLVFAYLASRLVTVRSRSLRRKKRFFLLSTGKSFRVWRFWMRRRWRNSAGRRKKARTMESGRGLQNSFFLLFLR